jgi:hypothetical protein
MRSGLIFRTVPTWFCESPFLVALGGIPAYVSRGRDRGTDRLAFNQEEPRSSVWIKIIGACVYGFLYVKNVPLRVDLAPHRERWLLPQILLEVALSLDLANLSAFCIPFCIPVMRRLRWCGIAIAATFWGGSLA